METNSRLRPFQIGVLVLLGACQPTAPEQEEQPAVAASATAETVPASATELSCTDPVRADDTLASLRERYGDQARLEMVAGPDGDFSAVVLWPDDPARRIEVVAADERSPLPVSAVRLPRTSTRRLAGLAVGDPLARANEVNGKPFKLWGFSWDYGGYVSDLGGGKLAALPGGCRVVLRLSPREGTEVPDALMGEVELSSDDPRLEAAGVAIEELSLAF
jgi:hypothetical protein